MKRACKRGVSLVLAQIIVLVSIAVIGNIQVCAATFDEINQSSIWIKQSQSGPCVLDACAMMIRRTLIATGNTNWASVTENSLKGTACQSGWSVWYSFDYMGVSVRHTSFNSTATSLKSILDSHPEGIVLFSRSKGHAVLVTDYSGDTFYCADPAYGDKRNLNSANQGVSYSNSTEYWYVSSPKVTLTVGHAPTIDVNTISGGMRSISLRGWAFDEDSVGTSLEVHVYIGGDYDSGGEGHVIIANTYRPDVNNVYGVGDYHGFDATISTNKIGEQDIYIYFIGVGEGGWSRYVTRLTIVDGHNPVGDLNHIVGGICNINVRGWTFDEDALESPVEVDIYIGGDCGVGEGHAILANTYRPDVHNAYGVGENHGFDATISTTKTGHQPVYVYILNYGNGANVLLWSGYVDIDADTSAPIIKNAYITNRGWGGYTVVCEFEDNTGVTRVDFPTWTTENGQDDLVFYPGTIVQNESYAYGLIGRVNHGYEYGEYITDVYVYDAAGNFSIKTVRVNVENKKPVISNARITNITPQGYTVSCDIEDDSEIAEIKFPTWTANTGHNATDQDDIEWPKVTYDGKTASYEVKVSNHNNETGRYKTHIYVYDVWENCKTFLFEDIYVPSENELYTITYNPNSGSNAPEGHSDYVNIKLSDSVPVRTGFTFVGWSTSSSSTDAEYQPGDMISPGQSITLYAVWKKDFILGDADGDGDVGLMDVVQITRYLAGGWDITVDVTAADVNKDGKVDLRDVAVLRRYLAGGWGVVLE